MDIKHITQPTNDTCMTTCLAMILDKDVAWIKAHHEDIFNYRKWHDDYLREAGIPFYYGSPRSGRLSGNVLALLTVASLNHLGGLHQILVEHRNNGTIEIFDPAKGRPMTKYYVPRGCIKDLSKQVELESWTIDLIIPLVEQ